MKVELVGTYGCDECWRAFTAEIVRQFEELRRAGIDPAEGTRS